MIKVNISTAEKVKLEIGDVVEFKDGLALIVDNRKSDERFPIGVLTLPECIVVNGHRSLITLQETGCSQMGKVVKIHKKAELTLGGKD
jgi:uncharacterized protein YkvS